jgi:hypothetical protein
VFVFQSLEERIGTRAVKVAVFCAPIVCLIGSFLITAGTDECWILAGVRGLATHGVYGQGSPFRSVHSTGGAYTLLAAALYKAGQGRLEVVRLLSVASLAGMLFVLQRWNRQVTGLKDEVNWLGAAVLFVVPGTFMLGSQAYGEVLATLLLVVGAMLWGTLPQGTWRRRLWVGLILGTAGATRLNCIVSLPALLIAALFSGTRKRTESLEASVTLLVGLAVFSVEWKLLWLLSVDPGSAVAANTAYGRGSPWGLPLGYLIPLGLGFWSISRDFMPFFLLVLISTGWGLVRSRIPAPRGGDLLVCTAWLMWLAWHAAAPIPHLRYLWPALACFAAIGGLVISFVSMQAPWTEKRWWRPTLRVIALAVLFGGYMDAARTFIHGDGDVLSWEWQRGTPYTYQFGPFRSLRSQKEMVLRLNAIPSNEVIATLGFDTALSYLTKRSILTVSSYYPRGLHDDVYQASSSDASRLGFPRWIVLTPFVNRFQGGHLTPMLHRWIEENCRLDVKFGPYVLYEITGHFPRTPEIFSLDLWEPRLPLVPGT